MTVTLRPLVASDAEFVFAMMRDPASVAMVGFTIPDLDRATFDPWFENLRSSPDIRSFAVLDEEALAGVAAVYNLATAPEVTYWIDRAQWGRGIASRALELMVVEVPVRPLIAGAGADNAASLAVLHRSGFREFTRERAMALGRGVEMEAVRLRLE